MHKKLKVNVITQNNRPERKERVLEEFEKYSEFKPYVVDAIVNDIEVNRFWQTIRFIVNQAAAANDSYVLICRDDHKFSKNYCKELLLNSIEWAEANQADVLLGGATSVNSVFSAKDSILWVEDYTGGELLVIFRRFYQKILEAEFDRDDEADYRISSLALNKFLIFPFISIHDDYANSSAKQNASLADNAKDPFRDTSNDIEYILESEAFYGYNTNSALSVSGSEFDNVSISTYVINLPKRIERKEHILSQFAGRSEFEVTLIDACENEIGNVGLWESICKVIETGIANDDDLLVICEDDHIFSDHYSRDLLFTNIMEAHEQGADILSGGTGGGFGHALPVASDRFWVNHFLSTQFIVVYSKFFQKILEYKFQSIDTVDNVLSSLTSNKMVLFPFISRQKDFGYSDATPMHNVMAGSIDQMFDYSAGRLARVKSACDKYKGPLKPTTWTIHV